MKKILVILIIVILIITISGCVSEEKDIKHNSENNSPITQSMILTPKNITYFDGHDNYYESNNTTSIIYDDQIYLSISGDCMSLGRGIILYDFNNHNLSNVFTNENNVELINATLIVNYKTCKFYKQSTYIEWSIKNNFIETNIRPKNTTEEVTKSYLLFENNYTIEDITNLKIKYFNPQGGFVQVPISFDYVWIELYYKTS